MAARQTVTLFLSMGDSEDLRVADATEGLERRDFEVSSGVHASAGEKWPDELPERIKDSRIFVGVYSQTTGETSQWLETEYNMALRLDKPILVYSREPLATDNAFLRQITGERHITTFHNTD